MEKCRSKGTNFQLPDEQVLGNLMYSMVKIVNTVLHGEESCIMCLKVKRVNLKCSHIKKVIM